MNIIQIQNQLKGLPDSVIAGYVQNPNAQVPAYLALSELQRRKTTREEYQQNQQAPQQSVAQSLTSQIPAPQMQQPPQGLAALPMGNTPQPQQNFAQGGIVAFADGGDVDPDALKPGDDAGAAQLEENIKYMLLTGKRIEGLPEFAYQQVKARQSPQTATGVAALPPEQIDQAKQQIYEQLAAQKDAPSGIYTLDENLPQETIPEPTKGLPALTAPDFVVNDDKSAGPRESDVKRIRERDKGYGEYPNGEALRVVDKVRNNAVISADMVSKMKERQIKEYKESAAKSNANIKAMQAEKGKGITALPTPKQVVLPPTQPAPQTALEKAQTEYRAALAPDQKTRDDLTGRMQHLDEQAKWRRDHTDMDAVTKAGLTMMQAGARPGASFLGAVGAGGEAGIKSLAEARDFQYATEEKRAALQQQLTQLERVERIAIAKYGVDSEEAKMVRQDKITAAKALADAKAAENNADNTTRLEAARISAGASNYAANARERGQANSDKAIEARMTMAENKERRQALTSLLAKAQEKYDTTDTFAKDPKVREAALARIKYLEDALMSAGEGEQYVPPAAPALTNIPQKILDGLEKYPPKK